MADILKDIALQTAIIEALVTENRLLKAEIANLRKRIGRSEECISHVESRNGHSEECMSYVESRNGHSEECMSYVESRNGHSEECMSHVESRNGHSEECISYAESRDGYIEAFLPVTQSGGEQNGTKMTSTPTDVGQTDKKIPLPEFISPEKYINVANAFSGTGITRVSNGYFICAAKLLIHFHNNSPSALKNLQKLTLLSRSGVAKNMTSLRKRGIVKNVGFQRYAPTDTGRRILLKALTDGEKSGQ